MSVGQMGWYRMCNIHVHMDGGIGQACMFDAREGRGREAQGGLWGMRSVGLCEEGACATREVVGLHGAERAPGRSPSEALGDAVSQQSPRPAETKEIDRQTDRQNEGVLRGGHEVRQAEGRRESSLRRTVMGVSGMLRATRGAADAAVHRAKRFFFRDTG